MGIIDHHESELADLEMETRPEEVLAEIEHLQAIEHSKGNHREQRPEPPTG